MTFKCKHCKNISLPTEYVIKEPAGGGLAVTLVCVGVLVMMFEAIFGILICIAGILLKPRRTACYICPFCGKAE